MLKTPDLKLISSIFVIFVTGSIHVKGLLGSESFEIVEVLIISLLERKQIKGRFIILFVA